jgi:hypothetical protein
MVLILFLNDVIFSLLGLLFWTSRGMQVKTCFLCEAKHKFPYKLLTALWPETLAPQADKF